MNNKCNNQLQSNIEIRESINLIPHIGEKSSNIQLIQTNDDILNRQVINPTRVVQNMLISHIGTNSKKIDDSIKQTDKIDMFDIIDKTDIPVINNTISSSIISSIPITPIAPITSTISNKKPDLKSYDVLLRNIHLLDHVKPVLCDHLYNTLFHFDNDAHNDNLLNKDKKIGEFKLDYKRYFEEYIQVVKLEKFLSLLSISESYEKYKNRFVDNDMMSAKIVLDQETDINNKYDVSKKSDIDTIVSISRQNFLELALETYPDDSAIIRQYLSDLPRQNVLINNVRINDIEHMLSVLGRFNREIKIDIKNRKTISTTMLAIAFVCQSSFFMSFMHFHNKCNMMRCIIESDPLLKDDPRCHMYASDLKEKNMISIMITQNKLRCSFIARYRIVDVTRDKTIHIVKSETLIDVDDDTGLIVYEAM